MGIIEWVQSLIKRIRQLHFSFIILLAFLFGGIITAVLSPAQEARAEGEAFRWVAPNIIEMSGGFLSSDRHEMEDGADSVVRFEGSLSSGRYNSRNPQLTIFEVRFPAGVDCTVHLSIELESWVWTDPNNPVQGFTERYLPDRGALRIDPQQSGCSITDNPNSPLREFMESDERTITIGSISNAYPGLSTCENIQGGSESVRDCVVDLLNPYNDDGGLQPGEEVDPDTIDQTDGDEPVCTGGAMGWILCPLSTAAVGAMEQVGGIVQGLMLVQPLSIAAPETEPVYIIWNTMRNIANILFIIFFLIIIASYITSMGISNYGIKRTLPRLVIAAILVNISYFICAITIDLFNIIGSSIEGLFQTGINAAVSSIEGYDGGGASGFQIGAYLALFGTVLAGIIKVAGPSILLLLLPPLISALGAILTLFIILLARQFIITLLVIISPLVAVAWLLPGTEQYFKRGLNLFFSLLVSYPVVMAVIQASSLLVAIIHVNGVAPSIDGGGPSEWLSAIAILLVQVLVAVVVFKVLQTSVRIMNQLGVMGGGFISNLRGGIGGWAKERRGNSRWAMRRKELSDYRSSRARANYDRRQRQAIEKRPGGRSATVFGKRIGFGAGYESLNRAAFQNQSQERKRAEVAEIAKQLETDSAYRKFYSGEGNEVRQRAAEATGIKQLQSQRAEELTATKAVLESVNGLNLKKVFEDPNYLEGRFNNNDSLIAAAQLAIENGEGGSFNAALQRFSQLDESQDPGGEARKEFTRYIEQNMGKVRGIAPAAADQAVRDAVVEGRAVTSDMIQQGTVNTLSKKVKASEVVSWDGEERASVMEAINTTIPNNISNLESQWASLESELNTARSAGDAVREAQLTEEIRKVTEKITVQEKAYNNVIDAASTAMRSDTILSGAKAEGIDFAREVSSMPRRPDGS